MSDMQEKLRSLAKELLEKGEIDYIIGWEKGRFPNQSPPVFISKPEDTDKLVWDDYCINTLAKYTMDNMHPEKKIGLCVRGCDSRAVNRLIQDHQLVRENVYLIGLPCEGKKDEDDQIAKKCLECRHRNPVVYDVMLGDPVPEQELEGRFAEVEKIEAMSADERYQYWAEAYDKCIRCYACRNVCPACNCRECFVDQYRVGWQGKQNNRAENQIYGLTRAYHIGDRCIECGECERVCPVDLPLMALNRKLIKDEIELFGDYEAGMDTETKPPMGTYQVDDHEEYM